MLWSLLPPSELIPCNLKLVAVLRTMGGAKRYSNQQ